MLRLAAQVSHYPLFLNYVFTSVQMLMNVRAIYVKKIALTLKVPLSVHAEMATHLVQI